MTEDRTATGRQGRKLGWVEFLDIVVERGTTDGGHWGGRSGPGVGTAVVIIVSRMLGSFVGSHGGSTGGWRRKGRPA